MPRITALALPLILAACVSGTQPPVWGDEDRQDGVLVTSTPKLPDGFDPTKPGLQTGINADGTRWAIHVDFPTAARAPSLMIAPRREAVSKPGCKAECPTKE